MNQSIHSTQRLISDADLEPDCRASLASSCSKTLTQLKFDLMAIHINVRQFKLRAHQTKLNDLKEKLSQSSGIGCSLKQTIYEREQAMRDRHQTYLQYRLNTFFDVAPMAATNE